MRTWVGAVLLVPALAVALAAAAGGANPYLDFAAQFARHAALAGLAAALAFASVRAWAPAALGAGAGLLALAAAHVPAPLPPCAAPQLRVLFHNVWASNPDLDAVAAQVRSSDPDVVLFAETTAPTRAALRDRLADRWPVFAGCPAGGPYCGLAVAARAGATARVVRADGSGRHLATARLIAPDGRARTVAGAHKTRPWPFREAGAQGADAEKMIAAMQAAAPDGSPDLLTGDFNAVTWGAMIRRFADGLALRPVPYAGGSWPAALPPLAGLPIDNALAGAGVACAAARTLEAAGSDHRALLVELGW